MLHVRRGQKYGYSPNIKASYGYFHYSSPSVYPLARLYIFSQNLTGCVAKYDKSVEIHVVLQDGTPCVISTRATRSNPQKTILTATMKRTFSPVKVFCSLLIAGVFLFSNTASAQVKISCDAPKIKDWKGEAKLTAEFAKQQCDEAKELAKRANNMRKESEWFKNNGEAEKDKAKELRDQHKNRMRDAEKRREESEKVGDRRRDHEKEIEENLRFLEKRNEDLSQEITFEVYDTVSVAKPVVNGLDWKMGQDNAVESYASYKESLMTLLETDQLAVDSMGTLLTGEGESILQRAELHDRRAQQHFATAATTIKVAEQLEGAAMVSERAAIMQTVKATLQYVSLNSTSGGKKTKKEVERGISFIESHLDKLPDDVALFAQYEIAKAEDNMQ